MPAPTLPTTPPGRTPGARSTAGGRRTRTAAARVFAEVSYQVPAESLGAVKIDTPYPDVLVLRHRVENRVGPDPAADPHGPPAWVREVRVATLPNEAGLYYAQKPIGAGYIGCAWFSLADRIPTSVPHNLPGDVDCVLTATSLGPVPYTADQARHGEAVLLAEVADRWYLTNEAPGVPRDLPHGPRDAAHRLAAALEYAIAAELAPVANPDSHPGRFSRDVFRRVGVPMHRGLVLAVVEAVSGRPWAETLEDAVGRNLCGRAGVRPDLAHPAAERLGEKKKGLYAPYGWSRSKFAGRDLTGWLRPFTAAGRNRRARTQPTRLVA